MTLDTLKYNPIINTVQPHLAYSDLLLKGGGAEQANPWRCSGALRLYGYENTKPRSQQRLSSSWAVPALCTASHSQACCARWFSSLLLLHRYSSNSSVSRKICCQKDILSGRKQQFSQKLLASNSIKNLRIKVWAFSVRWSLTPVRCCLLLHHQEGT